MGFFEIENMMRIVIASLLVLGYVSATPAATESTCAANCFGQTCDFWVAQWGLDCKTVEKEYACSCSGCACQSTANTLGRTLERPQPTAPAATAPSPPHTKSLQLCPSAESLLLSSTTRPRLVSRTPSQPPSASLPAT